MITKERKRELVAMFDKLPGIDLYEYESENDNIQPLELPDQTTAEEDIWLADYIFAREMNKPVERL